MTAVDRLAQARAALEQSEVVLDDPDGLVIDTGTAYRRGEPVLIRVRRRGRRYDITDEGRAVQQAGRAPGWLERANRVADADGFNINRRGVVFVPAVAGRDIALLAVRLADASRAVYLAVLELEETVRG